MPRLRTALVTVAAGGTLVATGALATSAFAPSSAVAAPVAAVSALQADDTSGSGATGDGSGQHRGGHGARAWWQKLSDTQQQCLENADITRPVGPLDDAQRQALRDQVQKAADSCGVELPFAKRRAFWSGLTDEQRQCLTDAKVTRPWGPMTKAERKQVRSDLQAAATQCGVTLPEHTKKSDRSGSSTTPTPSASPSATAS